jgi:hypothetical protein
MLGIEGWGRFGAVEFGVGDQRRSFPNSSLIGGTFVTGVQAPGRDDDAMVVQGRPAVAVPVDRVDDKTVAPERLQYLDNLKIVLTVGVIIAHAAMTYGAAGTWLYEEPSLSGVAEGVLGALVGLGVLFGLGLFFLIAGMLTTGPLTRRGPRRFLASRWWRLGVPLVAYAVVVWPMLRWLTDRVEGDRQSLFEFYRFEFTGSRWRSLGTGPLWFVAILLVVTTGWTLWRWAHPAPVTAGSGPLVLRHLAVTAATIAASTFFVRVWFPVDSEQFLDLHVWLWPQSAALFVLGAISSERGWMTEFPDTLRHQCHCAAISAVVAMAALIALSSGPEPFKGGWYWEAAGYAVVEGVFSVSVALIVLDRFRRRHADQGHLARRLGRSAYGAFVAQGPVLVLIALALRQLNVAGDIKFLLLAPAAVIGSFGLAAMALALRPKRPRSAPGTPDEASFEGDA